MTPPVGVPWLEAPSHKVWKLGLLEGVDPPPGTGALMGVQSEPWYIAKVCYEAGWQEAFELMTTVQVVLAESQGWTRAIHVNLNGTRDRGWFQLNSIHASITDEIAYDPVLAAAEAFKLWAARGGWEDWAAYSPSGVFLHDSYLGRAARGVGNFLARATLEIPVPDWNDQPVVHLYSGSILNYEHRLSGAVHWIEQGKKDLAWAAATKAKVQVVQTDLAHGLTASRQALPSG